MSDTNKVKKYTRKLFIETAQTEPIALGNEYYYVAKKINSDNFIMNPKLEEQLVKEGLYNNSYITFVTNKPNEKYDSLLLPIYGRNDKFVTDWFYGDLEGAIIGSLKDRALQLIKRANENLANQ